jgi:hypothetical protein
MTKKTTLSNPDPAMVGSAGPDPESQGLEAWTAGPRKEPNGQPEQPKTRVRTTTRGLDVELQAMAAIDKILAELSEEAAARVLGWILSRRGVQGNVYFGKTEELANLLKQHMTPATQNLPDNAD